MNCKRWIDAPAETIVCYCKQLTKGAIVNVIVAGANSVESIGYLTGAGTGDQCQRLHPEKRCCHPDIAALLAIYGGKCGGVCEGSGACGG